ncbi:MAG: SPFH domain-containing protein [Alistipes sp.]|nr:SPFH domain-containing protein [Alistipes sp.]
MESNKNMVYSGWKMNGFAMLFIVLLSWIGGPILAIYGGINWASPYDAIAIVAGAIILLWAIIASCGFIMLEPNEARVLLFFGKYRGNFVQTGYWWVNPFMSKKSISLRARNLNAEPIKVNDKQGNPILIGLVLVWKIREEEIYKAVFDIDTPVATGEVTVTASSRMKVLENFVSVQSDAALRQVAGIYAYDNNNGAKEELTLRSNADEINEQLENRLNERLAMAGIEVVEARINYLAYAPEIAAVMLRRQQADAIISAREKIVVVSTA